MNPAELKAVVEYMESDRGVSREVIIRAIELALESASGRNGEQDPDIRIAIDRTNFQMKAYRRISDGSEIETTPQSLGRIAAQTAKQVISQKVREAERERQFHEYKDRIGEIVVGTIKRVENHSVTIDLGRGEAIIKRDQMIPREQLRPGDRLRSFIVDVTQETRGAQIFLSRSSNDFLAALFTQEVPEIYDGIIVVKSVAREPGSRAKISVFSNDPSIDPVGACVGMRGSRVQAVVSELQGEKIEIIPWSEDSVTLVINALAPAIPSKVVRSVTSSRISSNLFFSTPGFTGMTPYPPIDVNPQW